MLYISSPFLSAAIQFSSSLFHLPLPDTDEEEKLNSTKSLNKNGNKSGKIETSLEAIQKERELDTSFYVVAVVYIPFQWASSFTKAMVITKAVGIQK